jgi:CheY-like chemotaxis protein
MQPLAIVCYERIMPGSQLVNRLQDLSYRVLVLNNPAQFAATVQRESPLLAFIDLETRGDAADAIARVKANAATQHVPVIAFAPDSKPELFDVAQKAGASLVVGETALAGHFQTLLDQALHLD